MPLKKITKAEILEISLEVFRKNGYHHTAMSDLAMACGLQKGSFYHYFESKEKLMEAILHNTYQYLIDNIFVIATNKSLQPRDQMGNILKKLSKTILMQEGGSIIGNMALETAQIVPQFKEILRQIFDAWTSSLAIIYANKFSEETSKRLAEQTVIELEGAAMLTKIYGGDKYFKDCYNRVISRF